MPCGYFRRSLTNFHRISHCSCFDNACVEIGAVIKTLAAKNNFTCESTHEYTSILLCVTHCNYYNRCLSYLIGVGLELLMWRRLEVTKRFWTVRQSGLLILCLLYFFHIHSGLLTCIPLLRTYFHAQVFGKHSCTLSTFSIAILNGICSLRSAITVKTF